MSNNYVIEIYTTGDTSEMLSAEELTTVILDFLYSYLGDDPSFYPADDPDDTGLYFNAAPYGNEYGATDVFAIGVWTDADEETLAGALDALMEREDILSYEVN